MLRAEAFCGVHLDHIQVHDGDLLSAHLAGADGALDDLGHVAGGAQRAHLTDHRAGAVGLLQTMGAVALDDALIAVALADAGDIHPVAGGEDIRLQLVAHLVLGAVVQTELALLNLAEPHLHGLVSVLLGGLLLHHGAGAGLDHGDGDHMAGLIEDLGHADLFSDDRFFHIGVSSCSGYWSA